SSRRRHTRFSRDWSSDVCSSDLALRNQFDDLFLVLAAEVDSKPQVAVMIGEKLMASNRFHAGNLVRELAKEIGGGGGGQPFFATAGGKNLAGLDTVLEKARKLIEN